MSNVETFFFENLLECEKSVLIFFTTSERDMGPDNFGGKRTKLLDGSRFWFWVSFLTKFNKNSFMNLN